MKSIPRTRYAERWKKLRRVLKKDGCGAFLISSPENLRYMTSLECSFGHVLCFSDKAILFTDGRYAAEARQSGAGVDVYQMKSGEGLGAWIASEAKKRGVKKVMVEAGALTARDLDAISKKAGAVQFAHAKTYVEELRIIKDADEIALIREACAKTDRAFKSVLKTVRPGMTEIALKTALDIELLKTGIDKNAFDTIIASGPNGAFAHAKPSDRKLRKGDFVVMDFGVRVGGYHSDMTRTIFIGKPTTADRQRYEAVNNARETARKIAVKNISAAKLDRAAREVLAGAGLEKYFIHGLGHGVGLVIHEEPRVSGISDHRLRPGMIFTIEPGIYIEGWGGIRIEDTCAMTETGAETLTKSSRALICV